MAFGEPGGDAVQVRALGEIPGQHLDHGVRHAFRDVPHDVVAPRGRAAHDHHREPEPGQLGGDHPPHPARGTRDERDPAGRAGRAAHAAIRGKAWT